MSLKSLTLNTTATLLLAAAAMFIATRNEPSGSSLNKLRPETPDHRLVRESPSFATERRSNDKHPDESRDIRTGFPAEYTRTERTISRSSERPVPNTSSLISSNGERRSLHHAQAARGTPPPAESSFLENHPDSPSADIVHINGLRIEVHGYDSPENGGDLLMSVIPESTEASSLGQSNRTGFSTEEERFRAKWGWVAFDQVRRTALASLEGTIR